MLTKYSVQLEKIFVGREEELDLLANLWEATLEPGEHFVYVLLNAPGTGKTKLLKHFGESLEKNGRGLFFFYRCSSRFNNPEELHRDLLEHLRQLMYSRKRIILESIRTSHEDDEYKNFLVEKLDEVQAYLKKSLERETVQLVDLIFVFQGLSQIIPLFFVADEIQEFQNTLLMARQEFLASTPENFREQETALHHFTRILKDLMQHPIMMVLSGTQFHILSQVGSKIGSPIAQKVKQILIKNFTPQEVEAHVTRVEQEILTTLFKQDHHSHSFQHQQQYLTKYHRRFLHSFSGGHPRTVVFITEWFLAELPSLFNKKTLSYDEFVQHLYPKVERDFKNRIFSQEQQAAIRELQAHESFPIIKDWIVNGTHAGLYLGSEPRQANPRQQEELNHLVYQLMTLGVIVLNGTGGYQVTSYFHLIAFLDCFTDEYVLFLRRVINDRLFKVTCGSHSGFGYTFEHVLVAAILLQGHPIISNAKQRPNYREGGNQPHVLPFSLHQVTSVEEVKGEIRWNALDFRPGILYHTPQAKTIDMCIMLSNVVVLIQATTSVKPNPEKIESLKLVVKDVQEIFKDKTVKGWFISLFPIDQKKKAETRDDETIIVTDGEVLEQILGSRIFNRLLTIKQHLLSQQPN